MRGFRINQLWDLRVPSQWRCSPQMPALMDDLRLHLVRGGRGAYLAEGQNIPMAKGLLMLFHPPACFSYEAEVDDPPSLISCHFDLVALPSGLPLRTETKPFFWTCQLAAEEYDRILPFFENISSLYQENLGRKFRDELCSSALYQLLGIVQKLCLLSGQFNTFDPRIEEARLHLSRNPLDQRPFAALAASYGLGKDYFTRLFHKQVGMSPKSYRLKCRMDYARYLISLRGDIKSVAAELGYSDQFVFSRLFKHVHGISPSRCKSTFSATPDQDLPLTRGEPSDGTLR